MGMTTRNATAMGPPMYQAIKKEASRLKGARNAVRTSIMKAIWMYWMSVVSRVTREAGENRSILANENLWIW